MCIVLHSTFVALKTANTMCLCNQQSEKQSSESLRSAAVLRRNTKRIKLSGGVTRDNHTALSAEGVRVHPIAAQLVHMRENSHYQDAMARLQRFSLPACDPGRSFNVDGAKQGRSSQTFRFSGMYNRRGEGRGGVSLKSGLCSPLICASEDFCGKGSKQSD